MADERLSQRWQLRSRVVRANGSFSFRWRTSARQNLGHDREGPTRANGYQTKRFRREGVPSAMGSAERRIFNPRDDEMSRTMDGGAWRVGSWVHATNPCAIHRGTIYKLVVRCEVTGWRLPDARRHSAGSVSTYAVGHPTRIPTARSGQILARPYASTIRATRNSRSREQTPGSLPARRLSRDCSARYLSDRVYHRRDDSAL